MGLLEEIALLCLKLDIPFLQFMNKTIKVKYNWVETDGMSKNGPMNKLPNSNFRESEIICQSLITCQQLIILFMELIYETIIRLIKHINAILDILFNLE